MSSITGYNPATISTLNAGTYRHVALSISGTVHSLYLDGSMVAQNLSGGNVFASYTSAISNLYIGCAGDLSYGLTGSIDDFKIWNRVLPPTDISAIYYANLPIRPIVEITFLSSTVTNTGSLNTATINMGTLAAPSVRTGGGYSFNVCQITSNNTLLQANPQIKNFGQLRNYTISWWMYHLGGNYTPWFSSAFAVAATNDKRIIGISGTSIYYDTYATTSPAEFSQTVPNYPKTNQWVHYVFTHNITGTTGVIKLYENGQVINNITGLDMTNHPGLGSIWNFPDFQNTYIFYKFQIYNFALSSDQVQALFNAQ